MPLSFSRRDAPSLNPLTRNCQPHYYTLMTQLSPRAPIA